MCPDRVGKAKPSFCEGVKSELAFFCLEALAKMERA